ncbi:hypothetical protein GGS23DRAFT_287178 [Durotheca rogersii]|uniref:uncharacterized protein n=1 Tax=Durotheca rogersii TaxID=419775 RepID=UPI00222067D5|nr:uncharacterized protein GGS23DRAFT_287178 [Durotheca rogersii]KAI5866759.1 hypothetical protein GGS23DRAFT_287178 [Durotheca rogersii]
MRYTSFLLPLVAGVVADTARPRTLEENGPKLESRDPTKITHSPKARVIPAGLRDIRTPVPRGILDKRYFGIGEDDNEDDYYESHRQFLSGMDRNDDSEDNSPPVNGGAIAGGVVGGLVMLLVLFAIWYFVRFRPRRKLRREAERKADDIENYAASSTSTIYPPPPPPGAAFVNPNQGYVHRDAAPMGAENIPMQHRVASASTLSGPAPSTPALTYSPSATTTAAHSPISPTPLPVHSMNEKPPAYATVVGESSPEPQLDDITHQMGQVPAPSEPSIYHLPVAPQSGATDMKGEPISRY